MRTKFFGLTLLAVIIPAIAEAHAFGRQVTLPLPVNFYITGGILAFIASFVVLLLFSRPSANTEPHIISIRVRGYRIITSLLGVLGLVLAVACVVIGLAGPQDFIDNPLPNLFWIIFLLLFAYITALVGGLWKHIDPFRRISSVCAAGVPDAEVPTWMPRVPVTIFFALLWLELFSPGWGVLPWVLGTLFFLYTILCIVMSRLYGVETWFKNGEFFSLFFGLIGKFAPFQLRSDRVDLAAPGERLAYERPAHIAVLIFIFVMLGSTVVDGLRESSIWWTFIFDFNLTDPTILYVTEVLLLLCMPFLLYGVYVLAIRGMNILTGRTAATAELQLEFVF